MSAAKAPDPPDTVEARCVRLPAKADDAASLAPVIERRRLSRAAGEAGSSRDRVILRPSQ